MKRSEDGLSTNDLMLTRKELAKRLSVSPRTVDNLQKGRVIPVLKITPRLCRFYLPAVLVALGRYEVREAGRR